MLSDREQRKLISAEPCWICKHLFLGVNDPQGNRVLDHDHFTGHVIGAAHNTCNFNRKTNYQIPVYFHNLRAYDEHLLVRAIQEYFDREIEVIGQNMEKYLQIQ